MNRRFFALFCFAFVVARGSNGVGTGLSAAYYVDSGSHLQGSPIKTGIDPNINFDFIASTPKGLSATTNFSAKWVGKLQPRYSEQYLLMTYSDDGVKVFINGQLIINNWTNHAPAWDWNWIQLQAQQTYDIEIDYFQGVGGAVLQLWWQSPSQSKELVPQSQLYPATGTPAIYYVSPSGNDANNGLSPSQAWQTPIRVNQQLFVPGDALLFERGGRYNGGLQPKGSGTSASPISIGAYGSGALPVIDGSGSEAAIKLSNQEYWHVDSLDVTGGTRFGIWVTGDNSNRVLHHFRLTNLVVHDIYGTPRWDSGLIMVAPVGDRLTFDDVVIDTVQAYKTNFWYGIHVGFNLWYSYPTQPPLSTNITVRSSVVHDVYGDGITAAQAQNVLIEKNTVFETGLAPAGVSYTPNAIWSWQCDNTLIQYNEGYNSHSFSYDGGIFDIDWGSTNTTIQYNYGHDAQGYCVAVMGAHNVTTQNSVVRYNICSNNARAANTAAGQGDIFITTFGGGTLDGVQIYNNTGFWNPAADGGWIRGRGLALVGTGPRLIMNNLVYATASTVIDIDNAFSSDYNLFWTTPPATPVWRIGSATPTTLSAVRTSLNQELHSIFADPQLNVATYSGVGRPQSEFTPLFGSPAISAGYPVAGMPSTDFFSAPVPAVPFIGASANQVAAQGVSVPSTWTRVVSKNSGKCLDVNGVSLAAMASVIQWTCWGGANQNFLFTPVPNGYMITAQHSGLQLDVNGGPGAVQDGVPVIQYPYWGGSNEIWQVKPAAPGYVNIVALHSGKCLDVSGISLNDGALVQQWSCWGGDNQAWQFIPVP